VKKKIFILLPALLIAIAGALYFLGYIPLGDENATGELVEYDEHGDPIIVAAEGEALYLPLDPAFVVNFTHLGNLRYLQISLEVMYHNQDLLDRVMANMPAIRNSLILLLSDQEYEKLSSLSGKEELRREMITTINDLILTEDEEANGEIYITNYIMQ